MKKKKKSNNNNFFILKSNIKKIIFLFLLFFLFLFPFYFILFYLFLFFILNHLFVPVITNRPPAFNHPEWWSIILLGRQRHREKSNSPQLPPSSKHRLYPSKHTHDETLVAIPQPWFFQVKDTVMINLHRLSLCI